MILLINPDSPPESPWGFSRMLPPLGLAYIASTIEKAGFPVSIYDNCLMRKSVSEIKNEVKRLNPEIVGISCNSVNYEKCVEISKAVKDVDPNCKVVVGGPHPTYMFESVLEHREIDYAIVGEGEWAMLELVKCIKQGANFRRISRIPGVAYKSGETFKMNPPKFIHNLDEIPLPARHLLQMDMYDRKIELLDVKPVDIMNVVRGCPFNCSFCETKEIWGHVSRYFSPSRIVEEIEHLMNAYGTKGVYFIGDNFTINKKVTREVCELLIKKELDVEWICDTRVDLVSRDLLKIMREAGCRTIWFGVESGSPRILQKLNKGINLNQAVKAFKLCKEVGIRTACSFLLGIPGEKVEDMEATFRFARTLNPDWCQFNIFIAVPGSKLYDEVVQGNLYSHRDGFITYVKTDDFDYQSLLKIQRNFHKRFNRAPNRVLRRMRRKFCAILKGSN
ncbi:MAG: radical SAM protein [Candidatus Bathyarchaeia archaeon]